MSLVLAKLDSPFSYAEVPHLHYNTYSGHCQVPPFSPALSPLPLPLGGAPIWLDKMSHAPIHTNPLKRYFAPRTLCFFLN